MEKIKFYLQGSRKYECYMTMGDLVSYLYNKERVKVKFVLNGWVYNTENEHDKYTPMYWFTDEVSSIVYVKILPGEVDFISSRENLDMTPRTNEMIDEIKGLVYGANNLLNDMLLKDEIFKELLGLVYGVYEGDKKLEIQGLYYHNKYYEWDNFLTRQKCLPIIDQLGRNIVIYVNKDKEPNIVKISYLCGNMNDLVIVVKSEEQKDNVYAELDKFFSGNISYGINTYSSDDGVWSNDLKFAVTKVKYKDLANGELEFEEADGIEENIPVIILYKLDKHTVLSELCRFYDKEHIKRKNGCAYVITSEPVYGYLWNVTDETIKTTKLTKLDKIAKKIKVDDEEDGFLSVGDMRLIQSVVRCTNPNVSLETVLAYVPSGSHKLFKEVVEEYDLSLPQILTLICHVGRYNSFMKFRLYNACNIKGGKYATIPEELLTEDVRWSLRVDTADFEELNCRAVNEMLSVGLFFW